MSESRRQKTKFRQKRKAVGGDSSSDDDGSTTVSKKLAKPGKASSQKKKESKKKKVGASSVGLSFGDEGGADGAPLYRAPRHTAAVASPPDRARGVAAYNALILSVATPVMRCVDSLRRELATLLCRNETA